MRRTISRGCLTLPSLCCSGGVAPTAHRSHPRSHPLRRECVSSSFYLLATEVDDEECGFHLLEPVVVFVSAELHGVRSPPAEATPEALPAFGSAGAAVVAFGLVAAEMAVLVAPIVEDHDEEIRHRQLEGD